MVLGRMCSVNWRLLLKMQGVDLAVSDWCLENSSENTDGF